MWQSMVSNTKPATGTGTSAKDQSVWVSGGKLLSKTQAKGTGSHATKSNFSTASENHIYFKLDNVCLLYTSPSPRDLSTSRMPSSA